MHSQVRWAALVVVAACCAAPTPAPRSIAPIHPKFDHQPRTELAGDLTEITLRGLAPGSLVDITAERPVTPRMMPGARRQLYRAQATFRADLAGTLELARAAPVSGSYAGADLRGLFWSMTPIDAAIPDGATDDQVVLHAAQAGHPVAETTIALRPSNPDATVTPVGPALPGAILARLPGDARRPVVIVLGGSEGGDWFARDMAPRLASHGYAVLGLPYYAPSYGAPPRPELAGLPAAFVDIPVDRLDQARDWLRRAPGVDADHVALYGVSKGAEFALIAASRLPWLTAVVAIVPTDVVWEGWGLPDQAAGTRSSFAWHGEPLPFVPYNDLAGELAKLRAGKPARLRRPQDEGRAAHPEAVAPARIPVERYRGALLIAGGGDDGVWASGDMAANIERTRRAAGLATTALIFPDAGHNLSGTGWSPAPPAMGLALGGTAAGTSRAQAVVWRETLAFLARNLTRP